MWIVPCSVRTIAYRFAKVIWRSDRPRAMYQSGRGPDVAVGPDETVFFRWFSDWVDRPSERLRPSQIPIPDLSVNRSAHGGKCWFVLIPEPDAGQPDIRRRICMGIVRLSVGDVPRELQGDDGATYSFMVEHDPLTHNFQHCEIRVYRGPDRIQRQKQVRKIKKFYRLKMAEVSKLILRPQVATRGATS